MKPISLVVAVALAASAGCADVAEEEGMGRDEFVSTYLDLRRATVDGRLDEAVRDSILDAHGTTDEEMRAYVDARADDPDAIAQTWREITDSIAAAAKPASPDSQAAQ